MSGYSYEDRCPNCGCECSVYSDRKPIDYVTYQCGECGLVIYPRVEYMDLVELNEYREYVLEIEPLGTLPKQTFKM